MAVGLEIGIRIRDIEIPQFETEDSTRDYIVQVLNPYILTQIRHQQATAVRDMDPELALRGVEVSVGIRIG